MEIETDEIKEIVLADGSRFSYSVRQVEITNILGAAVAVLDEYFITKRSREESYKLYRTKDGNWYDLEDNNLGTISDIKRELKMAFESTSH